MERKLPACLQEQLGLVPSAVAWRLQQARQSWLCPGEPGINRSALALAQDLWGALGLGGWRQGPQGVRFSRASTFSHSPAHGEPTLAKGEALSLLKGMLKAVSEVLGLAPFSLASALLGDVSSR